MRIHPRDILPEGTKVQINGYRGIVVGVQLSPENQAHVHTVRLIEKYTRIRGSRWEWKPIAHRNWHGNYSFIQRLDQP